MPYVLHGKEFQEEGIAPLRCTQILGLAFADGLCGEIVIGSRQILRKDSRSWEIAAGMAPANVHMFHFPGSGGK